MTIRAYGVLAGSAVDAELAGSSGKPHYQIRVVVGETHHRVAVNVLSDESPSELLFLLEPDYHHPVLGALRGLADGYTALASQPGGLALDFVRGGLFRPADMAVVPLDAPGDRRGSDLAAIFHTEVQRAIGAGARFYAFGSKWGPEPENPDEYFGFTPGSGIHDIHLNQGSPEPHSRDNGVWQDGALFVHFPAEDRWTAFFLAFQSQFARTDDDGNPLPGSPKFGPRRGPGG